MGSSTPAASLGTERRLTAADGVELAYWVHRPAEETGRVLLLLHGAASNHTRWSELIERTSLKASWNILWPDIRGNGDSPSRGPQGIPVWCDDLLALLDAEGFEAAVVVGHSLGAQIAINLAHRAPERVRGLALLDPVFQRALTGKHGMYSRHPRLVLRAAGLISLLNRLGIRRRYIPNRDLRELDEETRQAMASGEAFEVIAKRYGALGPVLEHMPVANYLRQMVATTAPLPPLEAIACPVLVLVSAGITFADREINREEVARFPDVEVVSLDANHWPLTEAPDETRLAIEAWVEAKFA